ncbi:MAG: hypothetical protein RJB10_66 [Pseudomonadota bacterium]|jgi:hypothetical protein
MKLRKIQLLTFFRAVNMTTTGHHKILRIFQTLISHSYLTWAAWLRVLTVAPVVVLLWLAVFWASVETSL